ncbi:asparagine synthase C-terminal domain-containing protein [Phenylobacterium kunshanense]|nr:asparagine synthase C-terminal domain-containing protein [Phenylobacterium kunshanense]
MSPEAPQILAFAWPRESPDAGAEAQAWRDALRARGWRVLDAGPGLEVWGYGRPLAVRRLHAGLLLVGEAHPRTPGASCPQFDQPLLRTARALADHHWGEYLALLREPGADRAWVFRDPSGGLDALTWRAGQIVAVANEITHLPFGLSPHDLALDWDAITDFVRRPLASLDRCGLAGFHTVTPGDLHPLGASPGEAVPIWRPAAFAGNAAMEDAEARLRAVVDEVVDVQARRVGRAVAEVSGGLDSAIVAISLARAADPAANLIGLNYYGDRPEGDERPWARAACAAAGLPLVEVAKPVGEVDLSDFTDFARAARPAFNALDGDRDRHTSRLALAEGVDAVFTGKGGDAVLFQSPTPRVLEDYRLAHGRIPWGDPFALDVARWLRRSVWSARRAARRSSAPAYGARAGIWGARTREAVTTPAHRWLTDLDDMPPAKRMQVELVAASQMAAGPCRRTAVAQVRHPLLAQPVVELCLAIPAWAHVAGGRDRAVARRAFADRLPAVVAERRSKGALTSLYSRRTAASLAVLRPFLIEGVLAEAGVLDRRALDAALQPDALIRRPDGARVMGAAMVEAWVRHWQGRAPDLRTASRERLRSRA